MFVRSLVGQSFVIAVQRLSSILKAEWSAQSGATAFQVSGRQLVSLPEVMVSARNRSCVIHGAHSGLALLAYLPDDRETSMRYKCRSWVGEVDCT